MYSLLFAGYSAENRTKASGYEHIIDFKDPGFVTTYLDAKNLPFGFIPVGKRGKRLNCFFLEFAMHSCSHKYDLIHNFHPDNQLILKYPQKRKFKTIATTHLNYHDFTSYQLEVLKTYDAVIVLNSEEEKILKEKGIHAIYIPHGFDAPCFTMNKKILDSYSEKINICFSGVCYRDYKALNYFIQHIQNRDDVCLHILGQKKYIKDELRYKNYKNIKVYDFLSDDDYYSVLSSCDYSFLPLTFATANNTLMEAQTLGIRSILCDMEGVNDYAMRGAQGNLFYKKNEDLIEILSKLKKEDISKELQNYAQQFSWKNIFNKTRDLYINLLTNKGAIL